MERASQEHEEERDLHGVTAKGDEYGLTAKASYRQKKGDPFDVMNIGAHRVLKHKPRPLTQRHQTTLTRSGIDIKDLNQHQQSVVW